MNNDLKNAMKEVFKALENDIQNFETKQGNLVISYRVTDHGMSTEVRWNNIPASTDKYCEKPKVSAALETEILCKKLRKEFEEYMAKIDEDVFTSACEKFKNEGELNQCHKDIFENIVDVSRMKIAIKKVTAQINEAISEKVTALKSLYGSLDAK